MQRTKAGCLGTKCTTTDTNELVLGRRGGVFVSNQSLHFCPSRSPAHCHRLFLCSTYVSLPAGSARRPTPEASISKGKASSFDFSRILLLSFPIKSLERTVWLVMLLLYPQSLLELFQVVFRTHSFTGTALTRSWMILNLFFLKIYLFT